MKYFYLVALSAIAAAVIFLGPSASAESAELEAVRKPLENYLKGHETGNPSFMKKAFHTEGKLMFMRDGKFTTISFEDYIGRMKGEPAPDEANRKRYIESIDIFGDAAIGKIVLDYPNATITDYMSLLKIDGEWKIVNKSFSVKSKDSKER